jgi:hypothetical protein
MIERAGQVFEKKYKKCLEMKERGEDVSSNIDEPDHLSNSGSC